MTTATKIEYLVNQTTTNLVLKGGAVDIHRGGHRIYTDSLRSDPSVEYAIDREWLSVTDVEPKGTKVVVEPIEIQITTPFQGMTEEELKSSQTTEPVIAEVVEAKSTVTKAATKAAAATAPTVAKIPNAV